MRMWVQLLLLPMLACAATPAATPQAASEATVIVDYGCRADSDCAVKNVGNCCGYYPACVNKDSPTDPEGVKAQCEREGRMAICGFRAISACTCNAGRCEAATSASLDAVVQ